MVAYFLEGKSLKLFSESIQTWSWDSMSDNMFEELRETVDRLAKPIGTEKGTPFPLKPWETWKEFPDDYLLKKGEKMRWELTFSRPPTEEELEDFREGTIPGARYAKVTESKMIIEGTVRKNMDTPVKNWERLLESLKLIKNAEILGIGTRWILIGVGVATATGVGYVATR